MGFFGYSKALVVGKVVLETSTRAGSDFN